MLILPTTYEEWLASLRTYLDRSRGARTELARFLMSSRHIPLASARVRVAELLNGHKILDAPNFLALAGWLQSRPDAALDDAAAAVQRLQKLIR